jgi:hypothetical protein
MRKYYNPQTQESTNTPKISCVINPTHETILSNGWKEFIDIEPSYDINTEYIQRDSVTIDGDFAIQNYIILVKPIEIPQEISAAQGLAHLSVLGYYDVVKEMVNNSDDIVLKIFWERSTSWKITSQTVQSISSQLNIDLESFFIEANKINI